MLDGHKVIEIRAAGIDKGLATGRLMGIVSSDCATMGDDKTDEDIFNVLGRSGITVKVGNDLSAAEFNVSSQRDAFHLLDKLKQE